MTTREQMLWRALALHDPTCAFFAPAGEQKACTCGVFVVYRCPVCGYLANEIEMQTAFDDFGCCRCESTTLADFEPVEFGKLGSHEGKP